MNLFSKHLCRTWVIAALFAAGVPAPFEVPAGEPQPIPLPAPKWSRNATLQQALQERKTVREFSGQPFTNEVLSGLLWAGFGINRPENGHRTAPSAMNSQELDVYVALPDGVFIYDPKANELKPVSSGDVRAKTTSQAFATNSAAVLLFVADLAKQTKARPESKERYATFDAGCIVQNVYLYCAAEKLGAVVYDLDQKAMGEVLKLRPDQRVIMAQAVGVPK
jgi:SagB-type dehydrogenase family enzyme